MPDKLKDFVQAHREEFDSFSPRPDLWQDISAELQDHAGEAGEKPVEEAKVFSLNWNMAWRYAAAVTLLVVSVFAVRQYSQQQAVPSNAVAVTQPVPLDKIAPELNQIEMRFTSVIEQKEAQLKEYDLQALGMQAEWEREAAALDADYIALKKELFTTPNKDVLIQAMQDNLKMRIAILNRQLQVLEDIQKQAVQTQIPDETTTL